MKLSDKVAASYEEPALWIIDGIEELEAELSEIKKDAKQFSYLLSRAVDMLHECGLRDEIWTALEGKP
jgi:hypothetical protein